MHSAFLHNQYLLKRQLITLANKIRVYDPAGQLVLYSQQKLFKLREDIRVFADEERNQELLHIQARQIIDFSAAYDVIDTSVGAKVGALRRKGFRSLLRDHWEVLDVQDQPIGFIEEDSATRAMLRRLVLGSLLPQRYNLIVNNAIAAYFRQRFHLLRYEMDLDFEMDTARRLDRRLGIAAAILLCNIEGKQES